jgi:hypothetical protein
MPQSRRFSRHALAPEADVEDDLPVLTAVVCGESDDAGYSATSMTGAAPANDGSTSMADSHKWLGHADNSSDSLAQDNWPAYS